MFQNFRAFICTEVLVCRKTQSRAKICSMVSLLTVSNLSDYMHAATDNAVTWVIFGILKRIKCSGIFFIKSPLFYKPFWRGKELTFFKNLIIIIFLLSVENISEKVYN